MSSERGDVIPEEASLEVDTPDIETSEDPSDHISEGDEDRAEEYEENNGTLTAADVEIPEMEEEDEEIQLAMEMALAAAQNPGMNPEQLRRLVGGKNKQASIVREVEEKQAKEKQQRKEQEIKQRNEQKDSMFSWFSSVSAVTEAYQWEQTKLKYADQIKKDSRIREIRKAIKTKKKSLKAQRLQGNRVETRHLFKRQRMEKHLIDVSSAIEKNRKIFCETNYDATFYAKSMMKASKKWNKKPSNDEELALEAQLCRNMHQMLALEKQKSKCKKQLKEIKKYLQRCKSWLSDKQALCELHMLTLDATHSSMKNIYEDTLSRQDKLIAKLSASPEFEGKGDLFDDLDLSRYDEIPSHAGPGATLNALRGLPFKDDISLASVRSRGRLAGAVDPSGEAAVGEDGMEVKVEVHGFPVSPSAGSKGKLAAGGDRKHLYVDTLDDNASINSALTDPDDAPPEGAGFSNEHVVSADSVSGVVAFGEDAPWLKDQKEDEADEDDNKKKKKEPLKSEKKLNGEKVSGGDHL